MNTIELSLAQLTADVCDGEIVSTARQHNNGTYIFKFKSMPNKYYGVYKSGYVRCHTRTDLPNNYENYGRNFIDGYNCNSTPLIKEKNGRIILVNLQQGLEYLEKRFKER